jgi:hypothetical protein
VKDKFLKVETPAGRPENIGLLNGLKGPWIITSQHNEVPTFWKIACEQYPLTEVFELKYGMKCYQEGSSGEAELCGYYFDTSD